MNLRVYFDGGQWADGADQIPVTVAATPAEAASALVLREGVSITMTVLVVPADMDAVNGYAWGDDTSQPAFAQTCARFSVTAAGVATQVFP